MSFLRCRFVLPVFLALGLGVTFQASAQTQEASPGTLPLSADKAAKDGSVWGALIFASNGEAKTKTEDPEEFPDLAKRLGKVFPFKNFEIIGQHNQVVFREYESWVVPSRDVFLKLDSKGRTEAGGLNLHLQFWQGQQVVVKTDVVLKSDSPLFIGGPKWRDGQLIFLLELQKNDIKKAP